VQWRAKYEHDAMQRTEDLEEAKWVDQGYAQPRICHVQENESNAMSPHDVGLTNPSWDF
jgi:hypothetical protein